MNELVKFDAARKALAIARNIDEVKKIRDQARALELYIKQQRGSLEMLNQAAEIKLRAEIKAAGLLEKIEKRPGKRTDITCGHDGQRLYREELKKNNLPERTALRWREERKIPVRIREKYLSEATKNQEEITQAGLLRENSKLKQQKERRNTENNRLEDIPKGKYQTIVIDPPWPVQKIIRRTRPKQDLLDYRTMTLEEIYKLPVLDFNTPNSHLYLWTTQRYLPFALNCLARWDHEYVFTMVWHKPGGFQPFGLPQYNAEFVVFGRHGSLPFLTTKAFYTCFTGPRGKHSEKPNEFYDLINRVSPGPRLDMFGRKPRKGFKIYGD